jgi:hypothetical protein
MVLSPPANRDLAEIHHANRATGQKPAFPENFDARVRIEGQFLRQVAHDHWKTRQRLRGRELALKFYEAAFR